MKQIKLGSPQISLLQKLCNAVAVSGDEAEVRQIVRAEVEEFVDEVKIDAIGNLLAFKHRKKSRGLRILIAAHMDEVGLMVVARDGDGFYRFKTIGGIAAHHLAGKQIVAGKNHHPGVIGIPPIHTLGSDDLRKSIDIDTLRIDVGKNVVLQIGERVVFATRFQRVGSSIMAKSIDDRIGVASLIELIKQAPSNLEICAAFTVQEEIGGRGAGVAARAFKPDIAIVLDATPAFDLPTHDQQENKYFNSVLGLGPAIYLADNHTLYDRGLVEFLQNTAKRKGIPYQLRQPGGGGTDAGAIHQALDGIPSISVSVPHRYPHSPISIARISDWQNTLNLLQNTLGSITPASIR
jgi:endoglucanase